MVKNFLVELKKIKMLQIQLSDKISSTF